MQKQDLESLEKLVDSYGLSMTVYALASICGEKAEHIASNWQDVPTAKLWLAAANRLEETSQLPTLKGVSK